jgi:hypothetical protein
MLLVMFMVIVRFDLLAQFQHEVMINILGVVIMVVVVIHVEMSLIRVVELLLLIL